jgi:S1-C subfamily serine protease
MWRAALLALTFAGPALAQTALPTRKPPPLPYNPFETSGVPSGKALAPPQLRGQTPDTAPLAPRGLSSGTAFVVADRTVMTNAHVVQGCAEIRLRNADGREMRGTLRLVDAQRDLALVSAEGNPGPPLVFRTGRPLRRGEGVVTYGFPLAGLLSSGPTLTTGDVSALSGLRDDQRQLQISAPVQPGNSGGPLLDMQGRVAGIVTSKLNAARVAQFTGDIPQNINFAIKVEEALAFLRGAGITPRFAADEAAPRDAATVGEIAHASTLLLRCARG